MLAGGIRQFADARVENLRQLRLNKIKNPFTLLGLPGLSLVAEVVQAADTSISSELEVIKALSGLVQENGKVHQVILMIGRGLGTQFLKSCLAGLAAEGIKKVELTVAPDNQAARKVYEEKPGFQIIEHQIDEYGPGETRLVLNWT